MIPPVPILTPRLGLEDTASRQLRTYLRQEWAAEPAWLLAQIPPSGASLRTRIARAISRLRRRRAGPGAIAGTEPSGRSVPEPAPIPRQAPGPCEHPILEDLGAGGTARYHRCATCGGVFVSQGGRLWRIRPRAEVGSGSAARRDAAASDPTRRGRSEATDRAVVVLGDAGA